MKFLFWWFLLPVLYCYFIYPLLLFLWAGLFPRPVRKGAFDTSVSIIVALCNEEDVLERKINNLLSLEFPSQQLEILLGSDGSDDRTNEILRAVSDPRIKIFIFPQRRGKVAVLNDLVPEARGEVLVFTDARQDFAKEALSQLVRNFADPRVGCVSGELVLGKSSEPTGKGVNLYWEYEKFLRRCESGIHSMLGATGAIYAIRRHLYHPPSANVVLDDMYIPLKIVLEGHRAVFDGDARAYDSVAESPQVEHARKARTISGNYQIFFLLPGLFNPARSPVALQMFSHKLLRLVVPFLLIGLFGVSLRLMFEPFYGMMFFLQMLFYGLAIAGFLLRRPEFVRLRPLGKLCYVPYVFCLLNFSALAGFFRFVRSRQAVTWEKARAVKDAV